MTEQNPFKWRHFQAEIILLCVRWYLRYSLSSRDLEEMMAERGLCVDHTTIYRSRSALRSRTGKTLSTVPESLLRLLEGGRDVHQDQKSLDVSLSSRRFRREHTGVSLESNPRCRGCHTHFLQSAARHCGFTTSSSSQRGTGSPAHGSDGSHYHDTDSSCDQCR